MAHSTSSNHSLGSIVGEGGISPAAAAPEPALQMLYQQTFDEGGDPLDDFLGAAGAIVFQDGSYAFYLAPDSPSLQVTSHRLLDTALQARIRTSAEARASLRVSSTGNYTAALDLNGQLSLYRSDWLVGSATLSASVPGAWRTLRLSVLGSDVRVSIDGTESIVFTDPEPLPSGFAAFTGIGAELMLDDIELLTPQVSSLPPMALETTEGPFEMSSPAFDVFPPIRSALFFYSGSGWPTSPFSYVNKNGEEVLEELRVPNGYTVVSDTSLELSPDRLWFALVCKQLTTGWEDICIVKIDGTGWQNLTHDSDSEAHPTWSPDGRRLAYSRFHENRPQIVVVDRPAPLLPPIETTATPTPTLEPRIPHVIDIPCVYPTWAGRIIFCQRHINNAPGGIIAINSTTDHITWSDERYTRNPDAVVVGLGDEAEIRLAYTYQPPQVVLDYELPFYTIAWEIFTLEGVEKNPNAPSGQWPGLLRVDRPQWSPDGNYLAHHHLDYVCHHAGGPGTPCLGIQHNSYTDIVRFENGTFLNPQHLTQANRSLGWRYDWVVMPGALLVPEEARAFHYQADIVGLPMPFDRLPYNIEQPGQPTDPLGVTATPGRSSQGYGPSTFSYIDYYHDGAQGTINSRYDSTFQVHPGLDYAPAPQWTQRVVVSLCDGVVVQGREPNIVTLRPNGGSANPGRGVSVRCFADSLENGLADIDDDGIPNLSNIINVYNHLIWDWQSPQSQLAPHGPFHIDCAYLNQICPLPGYQLPMFRYNSATDNVGVDELRVGDVVRAGTVLSHCRKEVSEIQWGHEQTNRLHLKRRTTGSG